MRTSLTVGSLSATASRNACACFAKASMEVFAGTERARSTWRLRPARLARRADTRPLRARDLVSSASTSPIGPSTSSTALSSAIPRSASHPISPPTLPMRTMTSRPAEGSAHRQPRCAPTMPASAASELSTSLRWCHAFAISIDERIRFPIRCVTWNANSLSRIELRAALMAPDATNEVSSLSSFRSCQRCTAKVMAPTMSSVATHSVPTVSHLPYP
mmetsp:Transcript_27744/g.90795  ORF Transcript_27744/g.90795 Transcript_27744/m.90795 type:complete len:217 (+) Transcript_27744:137-787(+)